MSRCDTETLQTYFKEYGWVYRHDGKDTFHSGWRSNSRSFSLKVKLTESLVFFEVKLLALSSLVRRKYRDSILEYILDLNGGLTIARLSLDDDYSVLLSSECFTDNFDFEQMSRMLGIIGYFTEKLQKEILAKVADLCSRQPESYHNPH